MNECKFCQTKIVGKSQNKFCNQECRDLFVLKTSDEKYFEGLLLDQKTVKKAYLRHNKEECILCKTGPVWNGKILVLQLDHIDGDSDNNLPQNLQLLCPNCHSQTETFGGAQTILSKTSKKTRRNKYLQKYKSGNI